MVNIERRRRGRRHTEVENELTPAWPPAHEVKNELAPGGAMKGEKRWTRLSGV